MTLGQRIKQARLSNCLSVKQLAAEAGMSESIIRYYENDKGDPSMFHASCIADVLDVSLDWLVGRNIEEKN